MLSSRSEFLSVRGLRLHLREWGDPTAPILFLLHGWMDVSASFQFMADFLAARWRVVAPDWRGFGLSTGQGDAYWFPDYLGDLDAILRHYSPAEPVRLVGHSLGGNVACLYAGVRPERVAGVVALDGFGLADVPAEEAPRRYARWLDELAAPAAFREYPNFAALAERLCADQPRLPRERAEFLAAHLGEVRPDGTVRMAADAAHRRVNPILYRRAEALACWRRITAPVLWVAPEDTSLRQRMGVDDATYQSAMACFADFRLEMVPDVGHNLHREQPEAVARIIDAFFLSQGHGNTEKDESL